MPITDYVDRYQFDSDASDSGTGGYGGTLVGSPVFVAGKISNSVSLNGSTQSVTVPHSAFASITSDFTLSAWVYINSYSSYACLFNDVGGNFYWCIDSNTHMYTIVNGSGGDKTSSVAFSTGAWHFVAWRKSSLTHEIYVDNQLAFSFSAAASVNSASGNVSIGGNPAGGGTWLNGKVDDVRLFNRALSVGTTSEMTDLFNATGSSAKPWIYAQAMRRLRRAA